MFNCNIYQNKTERELINPIQSMEINGIKVDKKYLSNLSINRGGLNKEPSYSIFGFGYAVLKTVSGW